MIGVPVAVATALYVDRAVPAPRCAAPLTMLVDLLAAVPSVVYGLWGVFVLIPKLRPAEQWFSDTFSFLPFVGGHVAGPNYFIAGLILAIMIIPIVSRDHARGDGDGARPTTRRRRSRSARRAGR